MERLFFEHFNGKFNALAITAYGSEVEASTPDAEIRNSGRRALFAKYPMSRVSRAFEKGETQGFIKLCVDADTKQILGAAILGVGGDEVIHVLLDMLYAKAPYTIIQRAMHIHPTVAEYLPTILSKLEPFGKMESLGESAKTNSA